MWYLGNGRIVINLATVLVRNYGHFSLVQDACANCIPVASLAPTDHCAFYIFGQWLIGSRQTGIADPSGGVNFFGKSVKNNNNCINIIEKSKWEYILTAAEPHRCPQSACRNLDACSSSALAFAVRCHPHTLDYAHRGVRRAPCAHSVQLSTPRVERSRCRHRMPPCSD